MAASTQQAPAAQEALDEEALHAPSVVGNAFVHQYYLILHQSPELVHRFYQDISKLGRPEENGIMSFTTTMEAINAKILALDYGEFTAEISTVDAQESFDGGVIVLVTGYLTGKDNMRRKFTQSFFLAPQDKGYFVLNDMFRYVDDDKSPDANYSLDSDVEAPLTPDQEVAATEENHMHVEPTPLSEYVVDKVYKTEDVSVLEEAPVPEVVVEAQGDSRVVVESNSKAEEMPKKSYASILKVINERVMAVPTNKAPQRSVSRSQEQQATAVPHASHVLESSVPNTNGISIENGNSQDGEAEGLSIYIKGLPSNATPALLEMEFKKYGPIKSGGIQVRSQKGFCFGFVEFEVASAVQSAIEASPITIGGRKTVVEEKRSTSRGGSNNNNNNNNNRLRPSSGAGNGYRNEGTRGGRGNNNYGGGRGGGGGGGYGRGGGGGGDFGNRNDNGYNRGNGRGGFANRGGDGYQRSENGGGRMNRPGGTNGNVASGKSVAPPTRVSLPA